MKKLMMFLIALAFAATLVPGAYAAESAQLGLTVTFAPNEPLIIRSDPQGPFTVETGKTIEFLVIAEDLDSIKVELAAIKIPADATFNIIERTANDLDNGLRGTRMVGQFEWTPKIDGTANELGYMAVFEARNAEGEAVKLEAGIRVINRVISIELEGPNPWAIDGIRLGEKRNNLLNPYGKPLHWIRNTGNVPVLVDIGYGPQVAMVGAIHPGLEQGLDTFITMVGDVLIPPNGRVKVGIVRPDATASLALTYGAPTKLSKRNARNMNAAYELRAYKAIIEPSPDPAPNPCPKTISYL